MWRLWNLRYDEFSMVDLDLNTFKPFTITRYGYQVPQTVV